MSKQTTTPPEQNLHKDLHEQIAELREEIKKIVSTAGSIRSESINRAKTRAENFYEAAKHQGDDALESTKHKFQDVERRIAHRIREKPAQSLAVAALAGAVLTLIFRR